MIRDNFTLRTNTYPKIPDRYRLRSTDGTSPLPQAANQPQNSSTPNKLRSVSLHGQSTATPLLTKVSPNNHLNSSNSNKTNDSTKEGKEQNKEEEVIYF